MNFIKIKFSLIVFLLVACAAKPKKPNVSKPMLPQNEEVCIARGGEWIYAGPQGVTKFCFL